MRNKKGFTLIELLAVIVILSIILVIATTNVIRTINQSKEKTRYMAAKEIVNMAEVYFAKNSVNKVTVDKLLEEYLEKDATNPATGENDLIDNAANQIICKDKKYKAINQSGYSDNNGKGYQFDGYWYGLNGSC